MGFYFRFLYVPVLLPVSSLSITDSFQPDPIQNLYRTCVVKKYDVTETPKVLFSIPKTALPSDAVTLACIIAWCQRPQWVVCSAVKMEECWRSGVLPTEAEEGGWKVPKQPQESYSKKWQPPYDRLWTASWTFKLSCNMLSYQVIYHMGLTACKRGSSWSLWVLEICS